MGCTSSAPNMVAANPNATDKMSEFSEEVTGQSVKEDDDIISTGEDSGENVNKVLPSCDTLADPIQLDSNTKSMINTSNLDLEKGTLGCPINENVTENLNDNEAKEDVADANRTEEKLSSMEDVVEKIVELYVADNSTNNTLNVPEQPDQVEDSIDKVEVEPDPPEKTSPEPVDQPEEKKELVVEEATSPSQSTSSRATRWEALADIAAELPPSLTVDPITGQIYALSK